MDKMDLKKYGITGVTEIVYNPSYDELFREETKKGLRGFDKGVVTDMGAVNVMTGVYTGPFAQRQVLRNGRDHERYDLVDFRRI